MYESLHTFLIEMRRDTEGLTCLAGATPSDLLVLSMSEQETQAGVDSPYVRAIPLSNLSDLDMIERISSAGNVLIIKITPIARRSVEETKVAIGQLSSFAKRIGGDIARLGEERVVLTPPGIRIWRGKHQADTSIP